MSIKLKALFALFAIGVLVGACGREFRAIEGGQAIEAKAQVLASEHFKTFFDSPEEIEDHRRLVQELSAFELEIPAGEKTLMFKVLEQQSCDTADQAALPYTDQMILDSVDGESIPATGQVSYGFRSVCIPTSNGTDIECSNFLVAIQKQFSTGRVGTALVVASLVRGTGNFKNLHLSGELKYSTNVKTVTDVAQSLSCDGGTLGGGPAPTFPAGVGGGTNTNTTPTGNPSNTGSSTPGATPPIFPSVPGDSPVWDDPFYYPSSDENDTQTSPFGDDAEEIDYDTDPSIFN